MRAVRHRRLLDQQPAESRRRRAGASRRTDRLDQRLERLDDRHRRQDEKSLDRDRHVEVAGQHRRRDGGGGDQDQDGRRRRGPAAALSPGCPLDGALRDVHAGEHRGTGPGRPDLLGLPGHELAGGQQLGPPFQQVALGGGLRTPGQEADDGRREDEAGDHEADARVPATP